MKECYIDSQDALWEEDTLPRKVRPKKRRFRKFLPAVFAMVLLLLVYRFFALPIGWELPFFRQTATTEQGWNLILVNQDFSIPPDYAVELVTLGNGQKVDRRIYPDLQEMFDTMRREGVYPIVASGYRTESKQRQLLEEKTQELEQEGYSWWSARREALTWVSRPGTSEHQLGIAVDINQEGTRSTARQVYDWLDANAHRFGFVCRYPADKTHITGVSNEPWHYRYVGRDAAREIAERGLCLEEYLAQLPGNKTIPEILGFPG